MVVSLRITQRLVKFDKIALTGLVESVVKAAGLSPSQVDVGVWLAGSKTVAQLNSEYRHKSGATDILSFANFAFLRPGDITSRRPMHTSAEADDTAALVLRQLMEDSSTPGSEGDALDLGDMIICPQYVQAQCSRDALNEQHQYKVLAVHGLCHLLGYDHEADEEHAIMAAREAEVRTAVRTRSVYSADG